MNSRNPNKLSGILVLSLVTLVLAWTLFSTYIVPPLIKSAYRGESLHSLNAMISGQTSHPLTDYLSDWRHLSRRILLYISAFWVLVLLVVRPEFRRALWGSAVQEQMDSVLPEDGAGPHRKGGHLVGLLLYLILAVIFTLPDSLHPTRALLGRGGDNYLHAWFLWDFAKAVVHGHNPFHTDLILYPLGANLAWATTDPLGQIIAVPLSLSLGPVLTYNISIVLHLALAAFFARMLCLHVSRDSRAATIGGMIFGFSPFLLMHALGHLSLVTAFPIPLYGLALGRVLEKENPAWKDGALLGLALLLVALANYQYAVVSVLFTTVVLGIDFGLERMGLLKRLWIPLLASAATFLICFSPMLLILLKDYGVVKPAPIEHAESYSADLLGFLVPSLRHSFFGDYVRKMPERFFVGPGGIEGVEYIGLVALGLALIGGWIAQGKQRRWAGRAMFSGILFAALSLGPTVHFLGKPTQLPAPAGLLYKLNFMRFLREPARLSIITTLCVSLLASIGLAFLLNKLHNSWQKSLVVCLVGGGLLLEYITYPFPSSSIIEPARHWVTPKTTQRCTLAPNIRDCSVLTIPLDDWWYFNNAMWMQMMDGGRYRLIDGRISPYVPGRAWSDFVDQTPIMGFLHKTPASPGDAVHDRKFADSLVQKLNICAVVVFDAPGRPATLNYIRDVFSAKEKLIGTCAVFETASGP